MSAFCLLTLTGALLWRSEAAEITLRWTHSVQKTTWQEVWRREGDHLLLAEARIEGSGAGMEPPPEARKQGHLWVWSPNLRVPEVQLAQSGAAGEWLLCDAGQCIAPETNGRLTVCQP